ncbi:MAG: hypothetical protein MK110_06505 [Fuerstiella sp.]|nr:hypothetical protein [Fuerstiella sp.]
MSEYILPEQNREQSHDFSQNDHAATAGISQVHVSVDSNVARYFILRNAAHDGWAAAEAT